MRTESWDKLVELCGHYFTIYKLMDGHPALYTMDNQRKKCHDELLKLLELKRGSKFYEENVAFIFNNMHKYEDSDEFRNALCAHAVITPGKFFG